jgi:ferric-dicitrate binding protein FerR (iron transport regulator)
MEEHPDRISLADRAREIVRDLAFIEKPADAESLATEIWAGLESGINATTPHGAHLPQGRIVPLSKRRLRPRWPYWTAAACLSGLIITAAILKYLPAHNRPASQQVATLILDQDLQRTNQTSTDREILLVDGSKVILKPGARIRHAAFLQNDKREVYLEGNAFFEIAKDANRPFYVYTKDLVVHVLGTSFNVTTNKDNGDVTVLVQSGKVAVSKKIDPERQQLILVSNQKVMYKEQTHDLVRTNETPETILPSEPTAAASIPFNFEEAPVVEIFQTLENAYGIPLHYDPKNFSACIVTTSLSDETFEEKLKIICVAIGATYKIEGNEVFIDGKPCKE